MANKLKYLVIHCTATPEGREVTKADIEKWHKSPKPAGRGWDRVGYSDLINLKGEVVNMTPYNQDDNIDTWEITWGAVGVNAFSRHIVYSGGCDKDMKPKDTRNDLQKLALINYVMQVVAKYPNIQIAGHNHFAQKACPSFNTETWLKEIGVPTKNIYTNVK